MDYHINHIKIDPIHMYHARKDLPDNVVKSINKMIINGVKISSIIQCKYSLNIHYKTINHMRNRCIDDLLIRVQTNPTDHQ